MFWQETPSSTLLSGLQGLSYFERVDQGLSYRHNDTYAKQVHRSRDMRCAPCWFACVNLWTETVFMLQVQDVELAVAKDIWAWNANIMEEQFPLFQRRPS